MGVVKKQLRYLLLLQAIVVANWVLSKLMDVLNKQPNIEIRLPDTLSIKDNHCRLDDTMDGTRNSLKSWGTS